MQFLFQSTSLSLRTLFSFRLRSMYWRGLMWILFSNVWGSSMSVFYSLPVLLRWVAEAPPPSPSKSMIFFLFRLHLPSQTQVPPWSIYLSCLVTLKPSALPGHQKSVPSTVMSCKFPTVMESSVWSHKFFFSSLPKSHEMPQNSFTNWREIMWFATTFLRRGTESSLMVLNWYFVFDVQSVYVAQKSIKVWDLLWWDEKVLKVFYVTEGPLRSSYLTSVSIFNPYSMLIPS